MSNFGLQPDKVWRELVDALDEGLLILDSDGVIYANAAAARLLELGKFDLIGLDQEDVLALCQPNRLDIERLATVLRQDLLGPRPVEAFRVVTQRKRLLISALALETEDGHFRCLLLRSDDHWRDDQIVEGVVRDMRGPLEFINNYCDALYKRLESPEPDRDQLVELTKVIKSGVSRAMEQWENLQALYSTDPRYAEVNQNEQSAVLLDALRESVEYIRQNADPPPIIKATLPPNLPPIHIEPASLRAILTDLLWGVTAHLDEQARVLLRVINHSEAVQFDCIFSSAKAQLLVRPALFDMLPLSIVEQLIVQHGGRLWLERQLEQAVSVSFTLPAA